MVGPPLRFIFGLHQHYILQHKLVIKPLSMRARPYCKCGYDKDGRRAAFGHLGRRGASYVGFTLCRWGCCLVGMEVEVGSKRPGSRTPVFQSLFF